MFIPNMHFNRNGRAHAQQVRKPYPTALYTPLILPYFSLVGFYLWLAIVALILAVAQQTSWGHGHTWKHRHISLSRSVKLTYAEVVVWILVAAHQTLQFAHWYAAYHDRSAGKSSDSLRMWQATYKALAYNAAIQLSLTLLPTSRGGLLSTLFGIGYDSSLAFHRSSGAMTVILAAAHFVSYAVFCVMRKGWPAFWRVTLMIGAEPSRVASYRDWLGPVGLASLLLFLWVSLNSLERIRRNHFNWFILNHFAVFGAILLSFVHASPMVYFCFGTLALYVIDSIMRVVNRRRPYMITALTLEQCGYVRLDVADCDIPAKPGQWVSINIPEISRIEWHPFTICKSTPAPRRMPSNPEMQYLLSPTRTPQDHRGLSLLIKPAADDASWTRTLVDTWSAALNDPEGGRKSLTVYIDGPHGALPPRFLRSDTVLIIVGGSGIPGGLAIARSILDCPSLHTRQILFYWTCKSPAADQLTLWRDLLSHPRAPQLLRSYLHVTGGKEQTPRMSIPNILSQLPTSRIVSIYGCGPSTLMDAVQNHVSRIGEIVGDGFETQSEGSYSSEAEEPDWVGTSQETRRPKVLLHLEGYGR